jgi:DNA-binding MarR family transcriptional regulator
MSINDQLLSDLRLAVLNGESSSIRDTLLTQNQIDLVLWVNLRGKTTASDVARVKNVSIQNASSKLAVLHKKGYLNRKTESALSGGIEHYYTIEKAG